MISCIKGFLYDEEGVGVVEIVLILLVLIGLVLIFKTEIEDVIADVFQNMKAKVKVVNV